MTALHGSKDRLNTLNTASSSSCSPRRRRDFAERLEYVVNAKLLRPFLPVSVAEDVP